MNHPFFHKPATARGAHMLAANDPRQMVPPLPAADLELAHSFSGLADFTPEAWHERNDRAALIRQIDRPDELSRVLRGDL